MAGPVRARRLTEDEGRRLLQIVRRGRQGTIRVRRAMMIMASASGTPVPAIARLVAADEDTVREVIHRFNAIGLACLDPRWAGGRPRRINDADERFIIATAGRRPKTVSRPFTHWSLRKLAGYLTRNPDRIVAIGRERLRQILHAHQLSFQHTRTWKQSHDPDFDAKLDRIEEVTTRFPDRCFAFDQFGPLSIRPCHGCYSLGDDQLWGVVRQRKGADHTLAAYKTIRAARPDGAPIYLICDNLSANKTPAIRAWARRHKVELCLTPTSASWANPIEPQFGPLRTFTMAGSNPANHPALTRDLQAYLRWRNAHARHPDILAAQRRERARIRSERQHRWGRPRSKAA